MINPFQLNLVGSMSSMSLQSSLDNAEGRFSAWQQGQIDYLGADSFENIQKKLDASIQKP